ncbi:MAG: sigma-54-dependent Fis family transcriptional regulator [Spirochaetaceae bacterium]|nr:sigma-54-dependent Fis family transcriptional regulator [Spirochaetaceae bacterium]
MDIVLLSDNGHIRTSINKCIIGKSRMFKSYALFLKAYKSLEIDLLIIDDNLMLNKNLILENLILLDITFPIICLFKSNKEELHKMGSSLLFCSKPLSDSLLNKALCLLNIEEKYPSYVSENILERSEYLIGSSNVMKELRGDLELIGKEPHPIFISGETGSGKELAAKTLHNYSHFADKDMISINCSLLNSSISDSMLFGHDKGSYTGADSTKSGLVKNANNNTLFLDEIENLNPQSQAKLLRLIETGEYRSLGGTEVLKTNFRLLSASNININELIKEKKFRIDFFYRISKFTVNIPPLRVHLEDLEQLIKFYYHKNNETRPLENNFLDKLYEYDFPGNVRELNMILERSRVFSKGSTISLKF